MFFKLKVRCDLRTSIVKIKPHLEDGKFTSKGKKDFAFEALKNQMEAFYNYNCGTFLGIKDIRLIKMYEDIESYDMVKLDIEAEVYFFKVHLKQIVDFKVQQLSPTYVSGVAYNCSIQIPKDQLSNLSPTFVPSGNYFELPERERIRQSDFLRARVTSVIASNHRDHKNPYYRVKASCRSQGTGKIYLKSQREKQ